LNNAAKARFDPTVVATGVACINKDPWEMDADSDKQQIRKLYAEIIKAPGPSHISIMPSTAFAITLAAQNLQRIVKSGGKILLLQDQYPSAVYPWQDICQQKPTKFSLEVVPCPNKESSPSETWTSLILDRLSDTNNNISIACLPPLFWCDGSVIDLETIGAVCRDKGIFLIVDGTQAAGIYPLNVQSIQCCMMACSVHKWLRGPAGTCLVYLDETAIRDWQPLDQHDRTRNWHGRSVADRGTMTPHGYPSEFLPGAQKLDAGGRSQPILLPMLRVALEKVVQIDTVQAQSQLHDLMQELREWADQSPLVHSLPSKDHASHILGLQPQSNLSTKEMLSYAKTLSEDYHVILSVRCGLFRISPYLDTTPKQVHELIEALQAVLSQNDNGNYSICGQS
jgi:selenocysteine lyase/cysteine desulfurase